MQFVQCVKLLIDCNFFVEMQFVQCVKLICAVCGAVD
ncbi:hypothetical protein Pint_23366 [Pistacia integerrima]|nr:hypothetical protein Pint_23366 [Pistacia integerrima]